LPTSAYTYENNAVDNGDDMTEVLVTRKNTRSTVSSETFELPEKEKTSLKPREINNSRKLRRDIKTLNKGYVRAPSSQISIVDPKALEREAKERELEELRASRETVVRAGDDALGSAKVVKIKKPFPFMFVFLLSVLTLVFMYTISLYITMDDHNTAINSLNARLLSAQEEQTQLKLQLDSKFNLASISKIAQEEYGMVSADSLPKKYISLTEDDQIEVIENEEPSTASSLLSAFGDMISELLE